MDVSSSPLPTFPEETGSLVTSPSSRRPRRQRPGFQHFCPLGELQDYTFFS